MQQEKKDHSIAIGTLVSGLLILSSCGVRVLVKEWSPAAELSLAGLAIAGGGALVIGYIKHFRNLR